MLRKLDDLLEVDEDAKKLLNETHPGFTVACQRCNQSGVGVESDIGYSRTSGMWGSVDLRCASCGAVTEIFPYVHSYINVD